MQVALFHAVGSEDILIYNTDTNYCYAVLLFAVGSTSLSLLSLSVNLHCTSGLLDKGYYM